jgi:hypothetical protein
LKEASVFLNLSFWSGIITAFVVLMKLASSYAFRELLSFTFLLPQAFKDVVKNDQLKSLN